MFFALQRFRSFPGELNGGSSRKTTGNARRLPNRMLPIAVALWIWRPRLCKRTLYSRDGARFPPSQRSTNVTGRLVQSRPLAQLRSAFHRPRNGNAVRRLPTIHAQAPSQGTTGAGGAHVHAARTSSDAGTPRNARTPRTGGRADLASPGRHRPGRDVVGRCRTADCQPGGTGRRWPHRQANHRWRALPVKTRLVVGEQTEQRR